MPRQPETKCYNYNGFADGISVDPLVFPWIIVLRKPVSIVENYSHSTSPNFIYLVVLVISQTSQRFGCVRVSWARHRYSTIFLLKTSPVIQSQHITLQCWRVSPCVNFQPGGFGDWISIEHLSTPLQ